MKSSSKGVLVDKDVQLSNWTPDLLDGPSAKEQSSFSEEEILAVFRAVGGDHLVQMADGGISPIRAESGQDFSNWVPGELDWVPPFQETNWETWEDFEEQQPKTALAPTQKQKKSEEPVPAGPTSEEEAMEIIANARARADEIILEAQKKAEEITQQAQSDIQQSIADGHQQGWDQAQAEATSIFEASQKAVRDVHQWQDEMLAQSENMVLNMIRDIAKTMFGEGITLDETALQLNLNRVLENAKSLGNLRIFLNPSDAARLDTAWKDYQGMLTGNRIMIISSDKIKPGGCFVQGEMGSIDARVETQFDAVMDVFNQPELPAKVE